MGCLGHRLKELLKLGMIEICIAFDGGIFRDVFFAVEVKDCVASGSVSGINDILALGVHDGRAAEEIFRMFVQKIESGREEVFRGRAPFVELERYVSIFGGFNAVAFFDLFEKFHP